MRAKLSVLCAAAAVAWFAALAAGASFANDLAYACGALGVTVTLWDVAVRRAARRKVNG